MIRCFFPKDIPVVRRGRPAASVQLVLTLKHHAGALVLRPQPSGGFSPPTAKTDSHFTYRQITEMNTDRSTHWSLTINHPGPSDIENIRCAQQKGWVVDGQLEKGENGTQHYQIMLKTPQVRFSAVKKAFPRAHIEVARNVAALKAYVHKEETKEGDLPTTSEFYPSLSKFWQLVRKDFVERNWLDMVNNDQWWEEAFYDLGYPRDFGEKRGKLRSDLQEEMADDALHAAVGHLIEQGYHVEHFISPPNRYVFKKFHWSILIRAEKEILTQTCRQTDKNAFTDSDDDDEHTPCPSTSVSMAPASADFAVVVPTVHG